MVEPTVTVQRPITTDPVESEKCQNVCDSMTPPFVPVSVPTDLSASEPVKGDPASDSLKNEPEVDSPAVCDQPSD